MLEHQHSNPALQCFVRLLLEMQKKDLVDDFFKNEKGEYEGTCFVFKTLQTTLLVATCFCQKWSCWKVELKTVKLKLKNRFYRIKRRRACTTLALKELKILNRSK